MAPPKIEQRTITVPLHCTKNRAFAPVATQQLTNRLDAYSSSSDDGQSHWRPRRNGQLAPPASSGWMETASEMERYVRSGESAQDIADFALGEVEGGAQTLKSTAVGTARLIRHPIQCADQLGQAVMKSGPALSEFSKNSEEIVGEAIEGKWNHFLNASNRERGQMTGSGLTNVGLTLAPLPKMTTVVSSGWKGFARALSKEALAKRIGSLPGKNIRLWRAVGSAELESISRTGKFTQAPNGAEVKWFSGCRADVEAWRKLPFNSGETRTVVSSQINRKYAHSLGELPGEGEVWTVHMDDFGQFGKIKKHQ